MVLCYASYLWHSRQESKDLIDYFDSLSGNPSCTLKHCLSSTSSVLQHKSSSLSLPARTQRKRNGKVFPWALNSVIHKRGCLASSSSKTLVLSDAGAQVLFHSFRGLECFVIQSHLSHERQGKSPYCPGLRAIWEGNSQSFHFFVAHSSNLGEKEDAMWLPQISKTCLLMQHN